MIRVVHLVTRKAMVINLSNIPQGVVMYDPERQPTETSKYKQAQASRTEGFYVLA